MKMSHLLVVSASMLAIASWAGSAHADAAAGKAKFTEVCSECHEVGDFAGEKAADLTATIKKIVTSGNTPDGKPHKKALKLSDAEIADLAAYMSAGK
jgi:mono/diheme cytochrome c family protein